MIEFLDASGNIVRDLYIHTELDARLLNEPQTHELRICRDLGRIALFEPSRLSILTLGDYPTSAECIQTDCIKIPLDVGKFLRVVRELRAKRVQATVALNRFPTAAPSDTRLSITQIVRHQNARGEIARTLGWFRSHLKPERWEDLLRTLSRFLSQAVVYGQRSEFYFDGRNLPTPYCGCGFNGGIIPHSEGTFGIHT